MARTRRYAPILILAAAVAGALPALARDDEVDFALKLVDRGYEDLALKVIDRMASGSSAEKRGDAEFARCKLLLRTARLAAGNEKTPPAEVRAKFAGASKAYEAFVKNYPNHPRKSDAEFDKANMNKDFAYYLQSHLEQFDAKERDGVLKEAGRIFEDAVRDLTVIKEREQDKYDKVKGTIEDPDDQEKAAYQRNLSWLHLCTALHDRAMLLPPGDALRVQQMTKAIEESNKFLEETDGNIFGYYASMWLGLEYWHRGTTAQGFDREDIKQAAEWFATVVGQTENFADLDNQWNSLALAVQESLYNLGVMSNAVRILDNVNYQKAIVETVGKIESKLPSLWTRMNGLKSVVEKGRAQCALGRFDAAVETLNKASAAALKSDQPWGRGVDQEAKRALNEVIAAIPADANLRIPPEIFFKAAEGSRQDRDFGRAVRVYQRVLTAIGAEADLPRRKILEEEFLDKCWLKINECYAGLGRHLEAFYAADVLVQQYIAAGRTDPDDEIGALAQYRMIALQNLLASAPADQKADLRRRLEEAQKLLAEKFPEGATGTVYGVALQKLLQAHSLKGSGDLARAGAAYQEAMDNFRKVPENNSFFRNAQSRIGEALVASGKTQEGIAFLQAFIQRNLAYWKDPGTLGRERQPWGWSVFWVANGYADLKQYPKVVEYLEEFEKAYADASLAPTFPRVRYIRTNALKESGRGDDAEKTVRLMMKENADSGYTPQAALISANDLRVRAARAQQAGERKAAADLHRRAVELYDFWIDHSSGITADNYSFVGQLHDLLGDGDKASDLWSKALKMYEDAGDAENAEKIKVFLSGLLVGQGKFAQALPQFEDLFVKTPPPPPAGAEYLRAVFEAMKQKPGGVEAAVHADRVKKQMERMADLIAKDPASAGLASEARRAAGMGPEGTETMIRLFADRPELCRALSRAMAFSLLGEDTNLPADLRVAVFGLVKRFPDLMSNLARCYEELWLTDVEYGIRAVNLYDTLLDSAGSQDEKDTPGARYTERWFDWKYRMVRLYLSLGVKFQQEAALRKVCNYLRAMDTVHELERADQARENFQKDFLSLKDQAHAALLKMGKEGCK